MVNDLAHENRLLVSAPSTPPYAPMFGGMLTSSERPYRIGFRAASRRVPHRPSLMFEFTSTSASRQFLSWSWAAYSAHGRLLFARRRTSRRAKEFRATTARRKARTLVVRQDSPVVGDLIHPGGSLEEVDHAPTSPTQTPVSIRCRRRSEDLTHCPVATRR